MGAERLARSLEEPGVPQSRHLVRRHRGVLWITMGALQIGKLGHGDGSWNEFELKTRHRYLRFQWGALPSPSSWPFIMGRGFFVFHSSVAGHPTRLCFFVRLRLSNFSGDDTGFLCSQRNLFLEADSFTQLQIWLMMEPWLTRAKKEEGLTADQSSTSSLRDQGCSSWFSGLGIRTIHFLLLFSTSRSPLCC